MKRKCRYLSLGGFLVLVLGFLSLTALFRHVSNIDVVGILGIMSSAATMIVGFIMIKAAGVEVEEK